MVKIKRDKSKFDIQEVEIGIDGATFTVPFIPATQYTRADGEVKTVEPAWVTSLRYVAKGLGGPKSIEIAGLAMARAITLAVNQAIGLKIEVLAGPIAVSEACPSDTMLWDGQRIIMNEELGAKTAKDADGDQIALVVMGDLCIAIKNPILMGLEVFKFQRIIRGNELKESFDPLTMEYARQMLANVPISNPSWSSQFAKGHRVAAIGIGTIAHSTVDLHATQHMKFEKRIHELANRDWVIDSVTGATVTRRFYDLETCGLQAMRREANDASGSDVTRFPWQVQAPWNVSTVNANSVVKQPPLVLHTVAQADLASFVDKSMKLSFGFSRKTFKAQDKPKITRQVWYDDLWNRLVQMGLITFQVLKRKEPIFDKNGIELPPPILVKFVSPHGEVCGLTDVKRQNDDDVDALTYGFVVYPGITKEAFRHHSSGEGFMPWELGRFLSPQELLSHWMGTIDNTIINPESGEVTGYFPKNLAQWMEPKFATKVAIIQEQVLKIIAKRGDSVPLDSQGRMLRIGAETALNTVCVHYGAECTDWHELETVNNKRQVVVKEGWTLMEHTAKQIDAILSINWFSTKSDSKSYRKYVIRTPEGADPRRAGRQRSQLLRAIKKVTMKVAFVLGDTKSGVLITPSGIKKQEINDSKAFYPIVYATWEDYQTHLRSHNLTEKDYPVEERTFSTWIGEKRTVWVATPKACIRIGKLVDENGNKFMPRECSQFTDGDGSEIDLIFPVTELFAKRCAHLFLDKVEETTIYGYEDVRCLVGEFTFYRTGSASENSRPGKKIRNARGMDIFTIMAGLQKLDTAIAKPGIEALFTKKVDRTKALAAIPLRTLEVNLAYAEMLQALYIQFWKFFGDSWIRTKEHEDEGLDGTD